MSNAVAFISGLMVAGYLIISLFFLRFWRVNKDRLFGLFAAAFFTLALQRTGLAFFAANEAASLSLHGLRAFAFILILIAIADANRAGQR